MAEDWTVELGTLDGRITFCEPRYVDGDVASIRATIDIGDLHASCRVSVYDSRELVAWLRALGEEWRGWDGPRSWASALDDLQLTAHHDRIGHVFLQATFDGYLPHRRDRPGWSLSGAVLVEPGQLPVIATTLGHLLEQT